MLMLDQSVDAMNWVLLPLSGSGPGSWPGKVSPG